MGAPAKGAGAEAFRCAAPGFCARALDGRLSVFPPACRATMARPFSARELAQPAPPQSLQVSVVCPAQVLAGSMPDQCGNAKMMASDAYRQRIYEPLL